MRRTILAGTMLLVCGHAWSFDFSPQAFGDRYNEVVSNWDYVDTIYADGCITPVASGTCYRFGRGAGAVVMPSKNAAETRSIEYYFALGGEPIHGVKFAPWVTFRMLFPEMSHDEELALLKDVGPGRLHDIGGGQILVRKGHVAVTGELDLRNRVWLLKFTDEDTPTP